MTGIYDIVAQKKQKIHSDFGKEGVLYVQKEQFFRLLYEELTAQGVSPETAARQIRSILQSLTEEDLRDIDAIEDRSEVAEMATAIVSMKRRRDDDDSIYETDDDMKVYDVTASREMSRRNSSYQINDPLDYDDAVQDDPMPTVTTRGKLIFWGIFVAGLPLILAFLLLYAGVFGAVFLGLCAVIILLVAGLICTTAGGTAVSMVGIIYGITQIVTAESKAPGLYEIGLGITIGGLVLFAGILIYNLAIRLIPFLITLLGKLFRFCAGKLRDLFSIAKEACYRL